MLFLRFQLGAQRYLINTEQLVEVLPLVEWRRMPGSPPGVLGVFNYHGTLVPVLDLSELALGVSAVGKPNLRIALVNYPIGNGEARPLGLLLENATSFIRRNEDEFSDSPVQSAGYAGGVATDEKGLVQRLELQNLVPVDLWRRVPASSSPERV
jgi:chemotaxis-related protein WspB